MVDRPLDVLRAVVQLVQLAAQPRQLLALGLGHGAQNLARERLSIGSGAITSAEAAFELTPLQVRLEKILPTKKLPPTVKARLDEMVNLMKEALRDRIKGLEWMTTPTKKREKKWKEKKKKE